MDRAKTVVPLAAPTWPMRGLNIASLRERGWTPHPFNQFIVKVHSRCNLACDYCYIYEMADQTWLDQPTVMREPVFAAACRRIRQHVDEYSLTAVSLVFHGGEPLLAGHARIDGFARQAKRIIGDGVRVGFGLQTNGIQLDDAYLAIFDRHSVRVGVSIDGSREGQDRHRRFRDGRPSFDAVAAGLTLLTRPAYRHLFAGLLCTVDVANDPVETYEALIEFAPPAIDFLLPHGNWSTPPPDRSEHSPATPYGDWLVAIFDRWYGAPRLEARIRLFDEILALLLGHSGRSESVGLAPIRVAVIETDGTLEQVDALKSAFPGAARIGPPDASDPLAAALWHPQIVARQIGVEALCQTCRQCPLHQICGGGNFTHRYKDGSGFLNPSVYCADLTRLITHIRTRLDAEVKTLADRRA